MRTNHRMITLNPFLCLFGEKGEWFILSDIYKRREAMPHTKYRTILANDKGQTLTHLAK